MHRQPDKQTDMPLNILIAPDTFLYSTKFHPRTPQSKAILIHVNSTDYPLAFLKCTLNIFYIGYHKYTPLYVSVKHCLKILYISEEIGY